MEIVENGIIDETYGTDELIISTTQISRLYNVNPATAVKAVSRLAEDGILYKKPGIGMCVAAGAREKIVKRRKKRFTETTLGAFLAEARTLNITAEELVKLIREKETDERKEFAKTEGANK
jgi:DNA-binding transcriptional regulator YhcF (GntR family)